MGPEVRGKKVNPKGNSPSPQGTPSPIPPTPRLFGSVGTTPLQEKKWSPPVPHSPQDVSGAEGDTGRVSESGRRKVFGGDGTGYGEVEGSPGPTLRPLSPIPGTN